MSYDEPRPFGFSVRSYFDSAEAVWVDPEAEEIPFGEHVSVDLTGIEEEIAERQERDSARRPQLVEALPDHTWRALDLLDLGKAKPEPPRISGLLYPGRRHVVSGEAETGKSMLLLTAAADELAAERGVCWVDADDMGPGAVLERLLSLGVLRTRIKDLFLYLRPAEPLSDEAREHVRGLLLERDGRLVVFDAFNPALACTAMTPTRAGTWRISSVASSIRSALWAPPSPCATTW